MRNIIPSLISVLSIVSGNLFAQQGIHTSGGNASGTGGSVSYSVGQVFYSSQNSAAGSLNQGVQQPYELVVTEVAKSISSGIKCEVFPNPVVKELKLRINGDIPKNATWKLIDLKGVTVLQGNVKEVETLLPVSGLPMAAYNLQILSGEKEIQRYNIIKQ